MTERCVSSSRSSRAARRSMAMARRSTMFEPIARSFAAISARIRSRSSRMTSGSAISLSRISPASAAFSDIPAPVFFCLPSRFRGSYTKSKNFLPGFCPVLQKEFQALVGQDMACHRLDDRRRGGDDIGADLGAVDDVVDAADRGGEDLGLEVVVVVDDADILDQVGAVIVDVVDPADEGRDEAGAGLCREDRLGGGKAQRDVDHQPFGCESLAGGETIPGQG